MTVYIVGIIAMIGGFIALSINNIGGAVCCFGYALILWTLLAIDKFKNRNKQEDEPKVVTYENPYVRFFDENCIGWSKDPELNKIFLLQQQNFANEKLQARGYLFLNEVFDMLGMPRTRVGQITGWVYDLKNPVGDNFVDFGLFDTENHEDVVRDTNVFRLNFNADGNILNYLDEE